LPQLAARAWMPGRQCPPRFPLPGRPTWCEALVGLFGGRPVGPRAPAAGRSDPGCACAGWGAVASRAGPLGVSPSPSPPKKPNVLIVRLNRSSSGRASTIGARMRWGPTNMHQPRPAARPSSLPPCCKTKPNRGGGRSGDLPRGPPLDKPWPRQQTSPWGEAFVAGLRFYATPKSYPPSNPPPFMVGTKIAARPRPWRFFVRPVNRENRGLGSPCALGFRFF